MNPDEVRDVLRALHTCATRQRPGDDKATQRRGRRYGPQGVALWERALAVVEQAPDVPFSSAWELLVDQARGYLEVPEPDEGGEA